MAPSVGRVRPDRRGGPGEPGPVHGRPHLPLRSPRRCWRSRRSTRGGSAGSSPCTPGETSPSRSAARCWTRSRPWWATASTTRDLMLWFSGARPVSVYAQEVHPGTNKYPDAGWAMFRLDSGAIGVVESIWRLPESTPYQIDARMEVIGTEGALYINCGEAGLEIHDAPGPTCPTRCTGPSCPASGSASCARSCGYFANCVARGRRARPDHARGIPCRRGAGGSGHAAPRRAAWSVHSPSLWCYAHVSAIRSYRHRHHGEEGRRDVRAGHPGMGYRLPEASVTTSSGCGSSRTARSPGRFARCRTSPIASTSIQAAAKGLKALLEPFDGGIRQGRLLSNGRRRRRRVHGIL